jgi:hypothetical protein
MTSRINRIDVDDYQLILRPGGNFAVDLGSTSLTPGTFTIYGALNVLGDVTTVGSTELVVSDNTITINAGETGSGITLGTAGIIIDRGTKNDAHFFFDDTPLSRYTTTPGGGESAGAFTFEDATGDLLGIYTTSIKTLLNNDLYLLGSGTGLVTVTGTTDYEKNIWSYTVGGDIANNVGTPDQLSTVTDDDALVNAKGLQDYVRSYQLYNFQNKIEAGTTTVTKVEALDAEDGEATSRIAFTIDGVNVANIYENRFETENLRLDDNIITSNGINGTIILKGSGTGVVQIDDHMNFTTQTDPLTAPADGVTVYSKPLADGGTGLYFLNTDGTTDEFISRNKALLYSIIF